MKLRVLGCSGGSVKGRHLSCFLLNDEVALDAGGLAGPLTLEEQLRVRHVIVSHAHLDHNCGLPFFIDNIFAQLKEPITVYGIPEVVNCLQNHMFNDQLWPDFTKLPTPDKPTMRFKVIEVEKSFSIGPIRFTPIAVDHLTPTVGFLLEQDGSAVLYTSDTGPTSRVWEVASSHKGLQAIITEVSFANDEAALARASGHMTASILASELKKLKRQVPVYLTHTKPGHLARIEKEIRAIKKHPIELIEQGRTYEF